ncbi:MAG: MFS transporter [Pseudomonadales bacterium]|nr:MFS transporter [Pseudomonadales bacterium]MCP5185630.1 MFS transporter [Pseudomonadales bacterium]
MNESPPSPGTLSTRRIYLLLCGSLAAQALGQSAMFAVMPSLGREVGLLEIQVGSIIAASSLVFFFAGPIWGRASDRFGRRKVFLIGQLGYVFGGSLFAACFWAALEGWLTPLAAWLCLVGARMTQATLMSASQPAASAFIADITGPHTRARGLARIGAATNLGSIAGPAIGGALASISLLAPFVLAVVSVAVAFVASWFFLPLAPRLHDVNAPRRKVRFTDRRLTPWVIPGVLMFLGAAVVQQTFSFRLQDALQLDPMAGATAFGTTMTASALAALLAQIVLVQRYSLSPGTWLGMGLPLIALALYGMGFFTTLPLFIAANVVMGLGMGFAGAGFSAGASLAVKPEEQGAASGIIAACSSAGWIVGPLLGPGLYRVLPELPFALSATLVLGAGIAVLWRVGRLRRLRGLHQRR